jgi:hypothetical protein
MFPSISPVVIADPHEAAIIFFFSGLRMFIYAATTSAGRRHCNRWRYRLDRRHILLTPFPLFLVRTSYCFVLFLNKLCNFVVVNKPPMKALLIYCIIAHLNRVLILFIWGTMQNVYVSQVLLITRFTGYYNLL